MKPTGNVALGYPLEEDHACYAVVGHAQELQVSHGTPAWRKRPCNLPALITPAILCNRKNKNESLKLLKQIINA
jgi:hypothetical protein